ncbi:hypothetical protein Taro_021117 [Colocasia esculenta]|uniref:Uncharacterized protein n=1 Tax=Colocasia esculenta TaxID=4460 RepID=A0A843UQI2_COLES|nr:hypothetical protein [Colocasia esculenta]
MGLTLATKPAKPGSTGIRKMHNKFLVAGEQEIIHNKLFFFPVVFTATCTDHHLEVDQRACRVFGLQRRCVRLVPPAVV